MSFPQRPVTRPGEPPEEMCVACLTAPNDSNTTGSECASARPLEPRPSNLPNFATSSPHLLYGAVAHRQVGHDRKRLNSEKEENLNQEIESTMTEFWTRCEGQLVNAYRLEQMPSRVRRRRGLLHRIPGRLPARGHQALASGSVGNSAAPCQLGGDPRLSHPNLIGLFESGFCEIEGVPLLYVVMDRPEGSLAGVLPERALTETEAREMLGSTLDALAYLQEHGFVHGGVRPANIVAIGDENQAVERLHNPRGRAWTPRRKRLVSGAGIVGRNHFPPRRCLVAGSDAGASSNPAPSPSRRRATARAR